MNKREQEALRNEQFLKEAFCYWKCRIRFFFNSKRINIYDI